MPDDEYMTLDEYQKKAMRTNGQTHLTMLEALQYAALAIAGEAGELADEIKKGIYHGHKLDTDKLIYEAGDVLWGLAYLGEVLGCGLEGIARMNIAKLATRYPEKFTPGGGAHRGAKGT